MAYRSFTRPDVARKSLSPGTVRRIVAFARPYRRDLIFFILLVVASSLIVVANPVLFKVAIDSGVTEGRREVVIAVALAIAGLAIFDAALGLVQRWFSARIGEGLIYDLRTRVFGHVQRMPVAFFTRTQTGSLVSRLNSDVIGAQQ